VNGVQRFPQQAPGAIQTSQLTEACRAVLGAADRNDAIDRAMTSALEQRVAMLFLGQLEAAGADSRALTMSRAVWETSSTSSVVANPAPTTSAGRIRLSALKSAFDQHRRVQEAIIDRVSSAFGDALLVPFGQGLKAAFPQYSRRMSHDVDVMVATEATGEAVVELLGSEFGFSVTDDRRTSNGDERFRDWRLDTTDASGNRLHVDVTLAALSNSTSWLPPFVVPDLFAAARSVPVRNGLVRVPSDAHQLILLAQKALRNLVFDARVRCDAAAITTFGAPAMETATLVATREGLSASLAWALEPTPLRSHLATGALWERRSIDAFACSSPLPRQVRSHAARLYQAAWRRRHVSPAGTGRSQA
jgi:Uncharacterised nucleotidyltransferase